MMDLNAIASFFLGHETGDVGQTQRILHAGAVLQRDQTDARADPEAGCFVHKAGLLDHGPDAFRDVGSGFMAPAARTT